MKGKLQFYDYVQLECEPESVTSSWVPTQEEGGKPTCSSQVEIDPEYAFVRERPDTHKIFSLLTSLFCCLPLGLVAFYFSSQTPHSGVKFYPAEKTFTQQSKVSLRRGKVKRLYKEGDIIGAHRSSLTSLRLNHSACILGLIFWTIGMYCALMFLPSE